MQLLCFPNSPHSRPLSTITIWRVLQHIFDLRNIEVSASSILLFVMIFHLDCITIYLSLSPGLSKFPIDFFLDAALVDRYSTIDLVSIDDAYAEWYKERQEKPIDCSLVLRVKRALQDPESGKLFERHIAVILASPELNFRASVLDWCLYRTEYKGETVLALLLRQVDDFALSCNSEAIADEIIGIIDKKLQLPDEDKPPFEVFRLIQDFNGVLLEQRQGYIKIHCSGYIDCLILTHKWDADTTDLSSRPTSPLPDDAVHHLYRSEDSVQVQANISSSLSLASEWS